MLGQAQPEVHSEESENAAGSTAIAAPFLLKHPASLNQLSSERWTLVSNIRPDIKVLKTFYLIRILNISLFLRILHIQVNSLINFSQKMTISDHFLHRECRWSHAMPCTGCSREEAEWVEDAGRNRRASPASQCLSGHPSPNPAEEPRTTLNFQELCSILIFRELCWSRQCFKHSDMKDCFRIHALPFLN